MARGDAPATRRGTPLLAMLNRSRWMKSLIARFAQDRSGATAIEYGLIAAGIAAVVIGAVYSLGSNITAKFTAIDVAMK